MASTDPGLREAQRRQARTESRREREFYEYYDALEHLSDKVPQYVDITDPAALQRHVPVSSPDKALSAFCQLGAVQLRAKRGLLFFFNQTHAFILAEATPTLSLQDHSRHKDELWMGYSKIDRSWSVCEWTIQLKRTRVDGDETSDQLPLNIIPDLKGTQQFCTYPYVIDAPRMRFYAGCPIVSRGINIGAFCVLDDEVRPGLSEQEKTFLRE
ncbi:uncharacterized protein LTR77_009875 [Saxophila tyrrhenica]|uniref:GAF domain-containing protein n=1 Tax=Saxophila tyrrhenica TaxID=1690608 RepID=A0AAV9NXI5_9PEZI|nr:hypothetical protein LTR77_009875 [Saxophila tyrrhenica]